MSIPSLSNCDFVDISNAILRHAVEIVTLNPSSVIACIHALEEAACSEASYSGYLCFASRGVHLLAAETSEYKSPDGYEEVWEINITHSASGRPEFKVLHVQPSFISLLAHAA